MGLRGALDWAFRDRQSGRIVIGQWPNLPLWLFAATSLVGWIAPGEVGRWARVAASLCLAVWAADELLRGVNPWRRALGAGVLLWLAVTRLG